jgi:HD-like signal output (HDOD) protein
MEALLASPSSQAVIAMDMVIDRVDKLHSSPQVACSVLDLLRDPNYDVQDVARQLNSDPALAGAVLRLVNSSHFGLAHKVGSIREALTFMGTRAIRLSLLSFGLTQQLAQGTPALVLEEFWRRSLTISAAAKVLCLDPRHFQADEAYAAGLLADLGMLTLAQDQPDFFITLVEDVGFGDALLAAEQEVFGYDHQQLSGQLLSRWNLPTRIIQAVTTHHCPPREMRGLSQAVAAGNMLADVLWAKDPGGTAAARDTVSDIYHIDVDGFISLVLSCKERVQESLAVFDVQLMGEINCEEIIRCARDQFATEAIEAALDMDTVSSMLDTE